MTAEWGVISQELMKRGILVTTGVKERLLSLDEPMKVLNQASNVGFERGMLSVDLLDKMIQEAMPKGSPDTEKPAVSIGRTIAPIKEREPVQIQYRNNLPDWKEKDFSGIATDVDNDILVHYDITGNSTTEGKMGHIQACFNDRLESIRKMIVKNSRLPRKPQEIGRLNVEYRRYQGYENLAVAIGLVNEPRHTKNGHLMFGLEDETGEMNCLLTIRQGDDRDRMHEQVVEAGLMPDDVLGVSGSFSQTGDIFYVDDLFFPMKDRHEKKSAHIGVSVAFLSDIHVGSKTFLEAQWHKMVRWFHTDPLAKTIKYLILSGDCVDGVGIYPGQDKELAITDLFGQYSEFARLLELLPDWVECVMLPGNHDAVRP
ncbi:MAG: metallophosphoesterase, partial [Candidatus Thermoplasmatota archaeon]|nr:metallophosphoesterase [Candidatus Thermoplasmatota archaeon]